VHKEFSPNNSIIVPMPSAAAMEAECLRRRQAGFKPGLADSGNPKRTPRSMAKTAVISVAGIVTFSNDAQPAIEALSWDEQDRRFRAAAEALAKKFNTNLAALSVHRDETAIHAHFALHGFDLNGHPISKKMTKVALSGSQDTASLAFADLGITRGQYLVERIKRGDPPSKTRHRSVHQLHHDLPRELAEAHTAVTTAQERRAEMQKRVGDTLVKLERRERELADLEGQLAANDDKSARLEKRLLTYEKRLAGREAEVQRLENLANEKTVKIEHLDSQIRSKKSEYQKLGNAAELTHQHTATITTTTKSGEKSTPKTATLAYHTPEQMGYVVGAAADAEKRHKKLSDRVTKKIRAYQHATKTPAPIAKAGLAAVGEMLTTRYGITVSETGNRISVPPQRPATSAQVAAALYRTSREKKWPKIYFNVTDNVAAHITKMAVADGLAEGIEFADMAQRMRLFEAVKRHEREQQTEAAAGGKKSTAVDDKLEIDFDDDDPNRGPS